MSDNQWTRWIPLHEAQPPQGEYVLAWWTRHGGSYVQEARGTEPLYGGWWYLRNGIEMVPPCYWQPLPKATP
jgi:hypothetical protein